MFTGEPNRKRYTAGDIHRYHSGLMSSAERNALEKAALEDPLLEEALEGYTHSADPTNDLAILSTRLDERVARKRRSFVVFMRTWGAAAAVLVVVLLGGGIFIWYLGRHPSPIAAKQASPQRAAEVPQAPAPRAAEVQQAARQAQPSPDKVVSAVDSIVLVLPKHRRKILHQGYLIAQPAEAYAKADSNERRLPADSLQVRQAGVAAAPPQAEIFKKIPGVQADTQGKIFINRVLDNSNQPVPFASIRQLNSKLGVLSDSNGYFRLPLSDTNALVSVSAVGFVTREINANQRTPIQLDLRNTSLNDVVVASIDRKSFAEAKQANGPYHAIADSSNLEPIDGWDDYNHYLSTSLHLPEEVLHNNIHGDVALSFQLDKEGNPIHVSVDQSLCNGCDAEAKRLLLQGPHWKKKGKGRRGRLRIHF